MNRSHLSPSPAFQFYPGQRDYLARCAVRLKSSHKLNGCGGILVAADTGTGKSLFNSTLTRLLSEEGGVFTKPSLIVAPGGTLREQQGADPDRSTRRRSSPKNSIRELDEDADPEEESGEGHTPSQWMVELARFAPDVIVRRLDTWEQYMAIVGPLHPADGAAPALLPPGLYVTYYEAFFRNRSLQAVPDSWQVAADPYLPHRKLCETFNVTRWPEQLDSVRLTSPDGDAIRHDRATFQGFLNLHNSGVSIDTVKKGHRFGGWEVTEAKYIPLQDYAENIGVSQGRIRCLPLPSLSDMIEGDQALRRTLRAKAMAAATGDHSLPVPDPSAPTPCAWHVIALDEAHACCHLTAQVTQALMRLQPAYRIALTATPIPNIVSNLFPLMGWLNVVDWHLGDRRNAAWPYAFDELDRFNRAFLSVERDHTAEEASKKKVSKRSSVISSPARLLKLIKPTLAFISKEGCNPAYQKPKIVDVRVPLGNVQRKLYRLFATGKCIPGRGLGKARKQIQYLRALCADPGMFWLEKAKSLVDGDDPNYNTFQGLYRGHAGSFHPKVLTILNLVADILSRPRPDGPMLSADGTEVVRTREQVVIISARVGLTDTLARCLTEAGVRISRIDSTVSPEQHSAEAARFKAGLTDVMFMGAKCAAAHSFSQCKYLITGAIEYAYGPLHQGCGRVDRVNSRPGVTIYCVLNEGSIEEVMFDLVATKGDAAAICLRGQRVPRDFQPMDADEILANHIADWGKEGEDSGQNVRPEAECARDWPALRDTIREAVQRVAEPVDLTALPDTDRKAPEVIQFVTQVEVPPAPTATATPAPASTPAPDRGSRREPAPIRYSFIGALVTDTAADPAPKPIVRKSRLLEALMAA